MRSLMVTAVIAPAPVQASTPEYGPDWRIRASQRTRQPGSRGTILKASRHTESPKEVRSGVLRMARRDCRVAVPTSAIPMPVGSPEGLAVWLSRLGRWLSQYRARQYRARIVGVLFCSVFCSAGIPIAGSDCGCPVCHPVCHGFVSTRYRASR